VRATLSQEDEKDNIRPSAFFSIQLPRSKKHSTSFDLALIALQNALQHFRKFFFMRHVKVLTKHKNLINHSIAGNTIMSPSRIARITDTINQFDMELIHIREGDNCTPDLLSRGPDSQIINTIKESESEEKQHENTFIAE